MPGSNPSWPWTAARSSADQIGFRLNDPKTGKTVYTYIGVDFGPPGAHQLSLVGVGPFGNARFRQEFTILRTGAIETIRQLPLDGNVADGRTPVRVALELIDSAGRAIRAPVELVLTGGTLKPPQVDRSNDLSEIPNNRIHGRPQRCGGIRAGEPIGQVSGHSGL